MNTLQSTRAMSFQFFMFLQIMDRSYQLSKRARPNGVFPVFKASYCALGKSAPARETLSGKFFRFHPDLFQIFRINYSLVLAESLMRRVQDSSFDHHREIRPAGPSMPQAICCRL